MVLLSMFQARQHRQIKNWHYGSYPEIKPKHPLVAASSTRRFQTFSKQGLIHSWQFIPFSNHFKWFLDPWTHLITANNCYADSSTQQYQDGRSDTGMFCFRKQNLRMPLPSFILRKSAHWQWSKKKGFTLWPDLLFCQGHTVEAAH